MQELSAEEQDRALLQSKMVVVQANCDKLRQIIQDTERPLASEARVSQTLLTAKPTQDTASSVESLWESGLPGVGLVAEEAQQVALLKAQNEMLQRQVLGNQSDKLIYRLTVSISLWMAANGVPEGQCKS